MTSIRVVVIDDETVVRHALAQLLKLEADVEVVGTGGNGQDAVRLASEAMPDVVLMDLNMPVMDGLTAMRRIKQEHPSVEVCVLTVHDDDDHLFEALKCGAKGYLLKDATPDEVVNAIRCIAQGEAAIPAPLAARVLDEFQRISRQKADMQRLFSQLTRREAEILKLIGESKANREIAAELFLSQKTVKNHVSNILHKLEVNSRTEAAIMAVQGGLTT